MDFETAFTIALVTAVGYINQADLIIEIDLSGDAFEISTGENQLTEKQSIMHDKTGIIGKDYSKK